MKENMRWRATLIIMAPLKVYKLNIYHIQLEIKKISPSKMKQLVKESIETNLKEEKRLDVRPEFDV